jgi:hypothetical protein
MKHALDAVWQGLNLLKYDNFPALLVELTLIEAARNPDLGAAGRPQPAALRQSLQTQPRPSTSSTSPGRPASEQGRGDMAPVRLSTSDSDSGPAAALNKETAKPQLIRSGPSLQPQAAQNATGDIIEQFRRKVHDLRLTTFVLVQHGVTARLEDNRLVLSFDDDSRQALAYAGSDDNLTILREAARQLYGQHTVIELHRSDHGPREAVERAVEGGDPAVEPDTEHVLQDDEPSAPAALESSQSNGSGGDRPATFDDVIRLFGAGEVEE